MKSAHSDAWNPPAVDQDREGKTTRPHRGALHASSAIIQHDVHGHLRRSSQSPCLVYILTVPLRWVVGDSALLCFALPLSSPLPDITLHSITRTRLLRRRRRRLLLLSIFVTSSPGFHIFQNASDNKGIHHPPTHLELDLLLA